MKKVSFSSRPTVTGAADAWVANRDTEVREPTKRLTIDVPVSLHTRMKTKCAIDSLVMADVIRGLLEQRFPAGPS